MYHLQMVIVGSKRVLEWSRLETDAFLQIRPEKHLFLHSLGCYQ